MESIECYIEYQCRDAARTNQADHRPTYQEQLDEIREKCQRLFDRGQILIKEIGKEDLDKCLKLARVKDVNAYNTHRLMECKVLGQWVIVPQYVSLVEEMRKLREILI